jgi:hypothetical protein
MPPEIAWYLYLKGMLDFLKCLSFMWCFIQMMRSGWTQDKGRAQYRRFQFTNPTLASEGRALVMEGNLRWRISLCLMFCLFFYV